MVSFYVAIRIACLTSVVCLFCPLSVVCLSSVVCSGVCSLFCRVSVLASVLSSVLSSVCLLSVLSRVCSVVCLSSVCEFLSRLSSVYLLSFVSLVSSVICRLSLLSRLSSAMRIAVFHDGFDGVTHTAIRPHFPTWLFSKPLYRDSFRFHGFLASFQHRPCRFAWSRVSFHVAMRIAVSISIIRKISSSTVHGSTVLCIHGEDSENSSWRNRARLVLS